MSRALIAEDLWSYGEDALALAVLDCDDDTYRRIMIAAGSPIVLDSDPRKAWSVSGMAALGAVQVLTGTPRYCTRKRRRSEDSVRDFWALAGRRRPDLNDQTEAFDLFDLWTGFE